MSGHLDPTLSAILSELYAVSRERDEYRALLSQINEKLDDPSYLMLRLGEIQAHDGASSDGVQATATVATNGSG